MINLIPFDARRQIRLEYWARVLVVWAYLLTVGAIIVGSLLFPAYILVTSQIRVYEASAIEAGQRVSEYNTSAKQLADASARARLVVEQGRLPVMMATYDQIASVATLHDVEVVEYALMRTEGSIKNVEIRGVAATRFALTEYRDALRNETGVTKVDLPIASLAKDRDVPFTLTVSFAVASTTTL